MGLRQFAIAREGDALVTGDLDTARELLAGSDFFGTAFALAPEEQEDLVVLHCRTARMVAREILEREGRTAR